MRARRPKHWVSLPTGIVVREGEPVGGLTSTVRRTSGPPNAPLGGQSLKNMHCNLWNMSLQLFISGRCISEVRACEELPRKTSHLRRLLLISSGGDGRCLPEGTLYGLVGLGPSTSGGTCTYAHLCSHSGSRGAIAHQERVSFCSHPPSTPQIRITRAALASRDGAPRAAPHPPVRKPRAVSTPTGGGVV